MYSRFNDWGYSDSSSFLITIPQMLSDSGVSEDDVVNLINDSLSKEIEFDGEGLNYTLKVNGTEKGTIQIPKDKYLKDVVCKEDKLYFTFELADGEKTIDVDLSALNDKKYVDANLSVTNKNIAQLNSNLVSSINQVNESIATVNQNLIDAVNTINGGIENEIKPSISTKAEKEEVYTKDETDAKIADAVTNGKVDLSGYATTEALTEGLSTKVESDVYEQDKTTFALKNDIPDFSSFETSKHSEETYATKEEIPTVPTKVSELDNDSKFITTEDADKKYQPIGDYLTEHQSLDGYAKTSDVETKIETAKSEIETKIPTGFYTKKESDDKFATTESVEDVVSSIETKAEKEDVQDNASEIDSLKATLESYKIMLDQMRKDFNSYNADNVEILSEFEGGNVTSDDKDVKVNDSTISSESTVTAKSISLNNVTQDSSILKLSASKVEANDLTIKGELKRSVTGSDGKPKNQNCYHSVLGAETVIYTNLTFTPKDGAYNGVEVDLSGNGAKTVVFENCDFGKFSNNAINIFAFQDNATVTISNCHFASVSNALRISNKTNAKNVTINLVNCTIDEWEHREGYNEWIGAVIFEDYTSKNTEEVTTNNQFGGMKLNITNLVHAGKKVVPTDVASVLGTQDENQVVYVTADNYILDEESGKYSYKVFSYAENPELYPTVTFK